MPYLRFRLHTSLRQNCQQPLCLLRAFPPCLSHQRSLLAELAYLPAAPTALKMQLNAFQNELRSLRALVEDVTSRQAAATIASIAAPPGAGEGEGER